MLEIHQRTDFSGYESSVGGIKTDDEIKIIEAFEDGKVIGYCIYTLNSEYAEVFDIGYGGNLIICDGILRTVMLKAMMTGADRIVYSTDDTAVEKLKLCDSGKRELGSIMSVMGCGCKCEKKENISE